MRSCPDTAEESAPQDVRREEAEARRHMNMGITSESRKAKERARVDTNKYINKTRTSDKLITSEHRDGKLGECGDIEGREWARHRTQDPKGMTMTMITR